MRRRDRVKNERKCKGNYQNGCIQLVKIFKILSQAPYYVCMETQYRLTRTTLKVMSWNAQLMGSTQPVKLISFLRYVEQNKPDIICMQESSNNAIMIQGYNAYVARGATNAMQHGVVTYINTELGPVEHQEIEIADLVHLYLSQHDLHINNYYISWVWKKTRRAPFMESMRKAIEKGGIIAGDFSYLGTKKYWEELIPYQIFDVTRLESKEPIGYLFSTKIQYTKQPAEISQSDHLILNKQYNIITRTEIKINPPKAHIEKELDILAKDYGLEDIKAEYHPPKCEKESAGTAKDIILKAKMLGDPKERHKAIKAQMDREETKFVLGVEGVKPEDTKKVIVEKYIKDLSGPYTTLKERTFSRRFYDFRALVLWFYSNPYSAQK